MRISERFESQQHVRRHQGIKTKTEKVRVLIFFSTASSCRYADKEVEKNG
jgi:hypothetical protein